MQKIIVDALAKLSDSNAFSIIFFIGFLLGSIMFAMLLIVIVRSMKELGIKRLLLIPIAFIYTVFVCIMIMFFSFLACLIFSMTIIYFTT